MDIVILTVLCLFINIFIACIGVRLLGDNITIYEYNLRRWFYILLITGIWGWLYLFIKETFGIINGHN